MTEGLILLFGLLFIFSIFFPIAWQRTKPSSPSPSRGPGCGEIIAIPSASGRAPFKVTLVATGQPGQYPISGFRWDFQGDGLWDTPLVKEPPEYTFTLPGSHQIKVLILDEKKNSRVCSTVVKVSP